ncbi:MAG: acyltransferase family protein, partial [Ilumatobacteraceae bacterium]
MSPESPDRLRGLDGLRALAVLGVLAFHDDRLSGGFLGVDLFFALSGFLITSLLIRECTASGRIDLIGFWGRRLRRLLPAAMLLLVAVVISFRLFADTGEWIIARQDAPWAQFYVANWHQIGSGNGYWDSFAAPSAFEHLWSLAIEEQFYVVWPVLVWAMWKLGRTRAISLATIVGFIASATAMVLMFDGGDPTRVYMGTDTRAFSLLAGAVVALPVARQWIERPLQRMRRWGEVIIGILIVSIGTSWFIVSGSDDWLFRGGLIAHSVLAAIVAVGVGSTQGSLTNLLSWRPLVYVGQLSYALYLWHWPIFIFCSPDRMNTDGWSLTIIRMSLTLIFSMLSYHLVEQTVRHRARWAHGSHGRFAFITSMVGAIVVWVVVSVPSTTNAVDAGAIAGAIATTTLPTSTTSPASSPPFTAAPTRSTTIPVGPSVRSVYYFGDSIAYDMWPGIEAALVAAGLTAESGAFGGVGLTAKDDIDPIANLADVVDTTHPDLLVVQLSVWDALQTDEVQREVFDSLRDLANSRNLRVLLLSFPSLAPTGMVVEPNQERLEVKAIEMASTLPNLITYLDQRDALGIEFNIDIDDDGVPERKRDGIHVCPTGALRSAQWLLQQLESLYGISLPANNDWALGPWSSDSRYDSPPGACA